MSRPTLPINVLLADDDKDDCMFFKEALEELPISVMLTAVHDGEELMKHLAVKTHSLPHALFLDLNMPRMNGVACLEEIMKEPGLKMLPVIIYSTSYDEAIAGGLYRAGAHHYIRKSSDFRQLKNDIHHALTLVLDKEKSLSTKENFLISKV